MPINFNNVDNIYHGTTPIKKVYRGSVVEWDGHDYFYIENTYNGSNTITLTTNIAGSPSSSYYSNTVQYSKDKLNWTTLTLTTSSPKTINMNVGEKVYFRNNNGKWNYYSSDSLFVRNCFSCSQSHIVSGNLNSLLSYNNMDNLALTIQGCLFQVFYGDNTLTSAKDLRLPSMTLSKYCYTALFRSCRSLTTPPVLPAQILVERCYWLLFTGCSSLNSIIIYANDISASNCLLIWTDSVAPTGDFYNLGNANFPTGVNGIPTGWVELHSIPDYFYIENTYNGSNTVTITKHSSPTTGTTLAYSFDRITWTTVTYSNNARSINIPNQNQKIYFRSSNGFSTSDSAYYTIVASNNYSIGGSLLSLIDYRDTASITTLPNGALFRMFIDSTTIISASNASLDNVTTVGTNAMGGMFMRATNLTDVLDTSDIVSIGDGAFWSIYQNTAITTTPNFDSLTTVGTNGLRNLINGCLGVTSTPKFPNLTNIATDGLRNIAANASNVNVAYVPNIATWNTSKTTNWLFGVAANGIVYNLYGTTGIPTNSVDGIPTGWVLRTSL